MSFVFRTTRSGVTHEAVPSNGKRPSTTRESYEAGSSKLYDYSNFRGSKQGFFVAWRFYLVWEFLFWQRYNWYRDPQSRTTSPNLWYFELHPTKLDPRGYMMIATSGGPKRAFMWPDGFVWCVRLCFGNGITDIETHRVVQHRQTYDILSFILWSYTTVAISGGLGGTFTWIGGFTCCVWLCFSNLGANTII